MNWVFWIFGGIAFSGLWFMLGFFAGFYEGERTALFSHRGEEPAT